jgi:MmyB-like transcription regulator ligand binding domain
MRVRPSMQRVLDAMIGAPAWVHNDRLDFLAANRLGCALFSEMFTDPVQPVNSARFVFLNPRSHDFYVEWDHIADNTVAILRGAAGRNPYDKALSNLIGELSTLSQHFRTRWAAHDVRLPRTGVKRLHHPVVGDLELTYEGLELPADPGLTMFVYSAEPGSPSDDGLKLLASWAASQELSDTVPGGAPTPQTGKPSNECAEATRLSRFREKRDTTRVGVGSRDPQVPAIRKSWCLGGRRHAVGDSAREPIPSS